MYNILTDPIIRMVKSDGFRVRASLPAVYAALVADEVEAFPALRPHQRHAWHAFLVQLGAMAMHRAGLSEPPEDPETWAEMIRGLTPDFPDDEPWQMVVEDITKPAFMQPPTSSQWKDKDYMQKSITPDQLDTPDAASNHDLKRSVIPAIELDSWIFALITEQTTDAHVANNPAISRISGKGSRLAFSLAPSPLRLGAHVRRDITALLTQWDSIAEGYPMTINGHALLWTLKWDGEAKQQLTLDQLHPLYIEVCRRRRLDVSPDGSIYALRASGTSTRILGASTSAGKAALNGRTGDPWIPENLKREKALTLAPGKGFTYKRIAECLGLSDRNTGDWQLPLLCKATQEELASHFPMELVVRGIAPGEGQRKTGGYHERAIIFRHKAYQVFGTPARMEEMGDLARKRIKTVGTVENILKDAIATFISQGDDIYKLDKRDRQKLLSRKDLSSWVNKLDELVDKDFFEDLQDEFEVDDPGAREGVHKEWLRGVVKSAEGILNDATRSLPCPIIYRYYTRAAAERLFEGRIKQSLPFLFDDADDQKESEE